MAAALAMRLPPSAGVREARRFLAAHGFQALRCRGDHEVYRHASGVVVVLPLCGQGRARRWKNRLADIHRAVRAVHGAGSR